MNHVRHCIAQAVRTAFTNTKLFASVDAQSNDRTKPTIEEAYASQPKELATNFLVANISQSGRLPPNSERWLWRSLLIEALEAPWDLYYDDNHVDAKAVQTLLHRTVFSLRPCPSDVVEQQWDDEDIQGFRERLTPAQRAVIARFLSAVLQDPVFANKPLADTACQAIHWCWNDDATSTMAAKAHHFALRTYNRPVHESQTLEEKTLAIEHAFADTPYPKGPLMSSGWEEPAEYELAFKETHWRQVTPRLIDHNFSAFSCMTPDAFRYFIPAALCHNLGPGSMVDTEFHLVRRLLEPSSSEDEISQMVSVFSPQERWAIVDFLHFELMCYPNADPDMAAAYEQAMQRWSPRAPIK